MAGILVHKQDKPRFRTPEGTGMTTGVGGTVSSLSLANMSGLRALEVVRRFLHK